CLKQLRLQHNSSMAQTDHHSCREELMHGKFKFVTTREGNYSRTMVRARSLSFDSETHYRYLQTFASDGQNLLPWPCNGIRSIPGKMFDTESSSVPESATRIMSGMNDGQGLQKEHCITYRRIQSTK